MIRFSKMKPQIFIIYIYIDTHTNTPNPTQHNQKPSSILLVNFTSKPYMNTMTYIFSNLNDNLHLKELSHCVHVRFTCGVHQQYG